MSENSQILALWHKAQARGESVCLATVVHVQGSSYRKPGARMLVTAGGERAGTISGGCLEGEVSRKAWWLTRTGPSVQQYRSSFEEDGDGQVGDLADIPWGLGCGGTLWLLLQRDPTPVLQAIETATRDGIGAVIVSSVEPATKQQTGTALVLSAGTPNASANDSRDFLTAAAHQVLQSRRHTLLDVEGHRFLANARNQAEQEPGQDQVPAWFVEYLAPPPRLTIFGAGDDAQPIAHFAAALGWRVAVADGRAHLLRPERFPEAAELRLLQYVLTEAVAADGITACSIAAGGAASPGAAPGSEIPAVSPGVTDGELAVLLTHSFAQDRALLAALLPDVPGRTPYLGILGPLHRTERLLQDVAPRLGLTIEACLARLHAPIGLNLGAREPAAIALAIVAELQATLTGRQVVLDLAPPADRPARAPKQPTYAPTADTTASLASHG
jgi:xanthine dehydrogenase accessory factor